MLRHYNDGPFLTLPLAHCSESWSSRNTSPSVSGLSNIVPLLTSSSPSLSSLHPKAIPNQKDMLVPYKIPIRYTTCELRISQTHVSILLAGGVTAERLEKEKVRYETLTLHDRALLHRGGMIRLTLPSGPAQRGG